MENNLHVVCLSDIDKIKLIEWLEAQSINVIDLDYLQRVVHNQKILVDLHAQYAQAQGQTRKNIRQTMIDTWKKAMKHEMNQYIKALKNKNGLFFIGFNVYHHDYRVRLNLPVHASCMFYVNMPTHTFVSAQITYHLQAYELKIINGTFDLNLLSRDYLARKYEKLIQLYMNLNYKSITFKALKSKWRMKRIKVPTEKVLYVATLYKANDIIPYMSRKPIEGFKTKQAALNDIRPRIKRNHKVYLYKIEPHAFVFDGEHYHALQDIFPLTQESCMITI